MPAISAAYLEDQETSGPNEWCTFFEKAGAKGALAVRPIEKNADRGDREQVAEFLGLKSEDIGESNDRGYLLLDFDIEPVLPDTNAPTEVRAAVAAWLDDGFGKLRGKGRRRVEYFYRSRSSRRGEFTSAWAAKLERLAWVPCLDGKLRRPQDVLRTPDPAREDAPVAVLSDELLSVMEQEGVRFGTAIPESTALQRLLRAGAELAAEELAALLREVREQVGTDEDERRFEQAVSELSVPAEDGVRIPLARIVQRVGGRFRGALGGWVAPLNRFHERLREEWQHPKFPHQFPESTTGEQALAYLREVWAHARTSPDRLANEVRGVLPTAYAYCLEDMNDDNSLAERWNDVVHNAAVFDGREWIFPSEAEIHFDDIEDRRFFPVESELRIATGGHLGISPEQRLRTAKKLGLNRLSAIVEMNWNEGIEQPADAWARRFELICQLLRHVKGSGRMDEEEGDAGIGPAMEWRLRRVTRLDLEVSVEGRRPVNVPVNARLHEGDLTVSGRPIQFCGDAAKELLRTLSFGQRADLSADLTTMLTAIGSEEDDFALAAKKFKRSFASDLELPATFQPDSGGEEAVRPAGGLSPAMDTGGPTKGMWRDAGGSMGQENLSSDSGPGPSERPDDGSRNATQEGTPDSLDHGEPGSMGGSFTRDRALAPQKRKAEELKNALKGEVAPDGISDDSGGGEEGSRDADGLLGDEVYRRVAAQYERESGRNPEYGDPHQQGWDLRSVDPATGAVRLIEVKGRGRPWEGEEVVELSRAQVHKAFEMSGEQTADSWYLYVVERAEDGGYEVLPIENPVHIAGKWILCGGPWRMIAVERRRITPDPDQ